jgi:FkbM family methyltransferase
LLFCRIINDRNIDSVVGRYTYSIHGLKTFKRGVRLIRKLINIMRRLLTALGIIAFKRSSRVYIPDEEIYSIIIKLIDKPNPVIIDGGAHLGDVPEKIQALLPLSQFHCFEPDPIVGALFAQKFTGNTNTSLIPAALGDCTGKVSFQINASRPCNSILPTADALPSKFKPLFEPLEKIEVDMTTIDEYCRQQSISQVDCIKLDLQGYDYLALKGAHKTLQTTQVVLVEVWFKEIYKGAHSFLDIHNLMVTQGFLLYTLCGIHYGEQDELIWADAIFVNSRSSGVQSLSERPPLPAN